MTTSALPSGTHDYSANQQSASVPTDRIGSRPLSSQNACGARDGETENPSHAPRSGARRIGRTTASAQSSGSTRGEKGDDNVDRRDPIRHSEDHAPATSQTSNPQKDVSGARSVSQADSETNSFQGLLKNALQQTVVAQAIPSSLNSKSQKPTAPGKKTDNGKSIDGIQPILPPPNVTAALPASFGLGIPSVGTDASGKGTPGKNELSAGQINATGSGSPEVNEEEPQMLSPVVSSAFTAHINTDDVAAQANSPRRADLMVLVDNVKANTTDAVSASATGGPALVAPPAPEAPRPVPLRPVPQAESVRSIEATDAPRSTAPAEPMRNISLQLPGTRGVEIRLTDRAGQIHVDVRSGDAALTQDLRGNLHELVNSLERKGFSAEVSHSTEQAPQHTVETQSSKDSSSGDSQGGAFDRQQQEQERQNQANQSYSGRSQKSRDRAWSDTWNAKSDKEN